MDYVMILVVWLCIAAALFCVYALINHRSKRKEREDKAQWEARRVAFDRQQASEPAPMWSGDVINYPSQRNRPVQPMAPVKSSSASRPAFNGSSYPPPYRRDDDLLTNPMHPLSPLNPMYDSSPSSYSSSSSCDSSSSSSYDSGSSSSSSDSGSSSCGGGGGD